MADEGLLIWGASKGGENAANFRAGFVVPVRYDPTVVAMTTLSGNEDGAFDPASVPLFLTASLRLTSARALEYGRLSRLEMRVDARAAAGELKLEQKRTWLTGTRYEVRGTRVVRLTVSAVEAAGVQASQMVELDLERFRTTLSTTARYDIDSRGPETSLRISRGFGDALTVGLSVSEPLRHARPSLDARYTRSW
ncbi:hypothetical protein [Ciceribacter sp. L1K22]|uniref:hypothetical protein n=1 Tax=Ciceribacter sp. L1K22 TaxID=2820275 RepID=UPI001ABDA4EC|nr:hypothetical protein [Ciceribacter sp. L1K22]MBO3759912.1 hypothetical protein [Ciceribacter sp. L1K22]